MDFSSPTSRNVVTVSKLNRLARSILESEIGQIWVSAEISNFVSASSGHWYFTLKDRQAQVRAAMFRGANMRVKMRPKEGDKVLVRATVGIYEARGDYQLVVDLMEQDGEGALKQQFEALKLKLAGQGLFEQQHKKALPQNIRRVGIVTSSTGAALHDILTVIKRRNPAISIVLYPAQVQGELAPGQICQALDKAIHRNEVDILIVGRGGGSLEDLWCFNDEQVALSLFHCPIPVISAVGHEVDVTIADFVADLRAPTPSAAAELVSADVQQIQINIEQLQHRLSSATKQRLAVLRHMQQIMQQKLNQTHPLNRMQQQSQHLDRLTINLQHSISNYLNIARQRVAQTRHELALCSPAHKLKTYQQHIGANERRLASAINNQLKQQRLRLSNASQLLETVSPLATLSRGYSISFKQDEIVRSAQQLQSGDEMVSQFHDGKVRSKVI